MSHPLVNPIWHALGGAQSAMAESVGNARRYPPDMSPFAGLPDQPHADDWDALRRLVGPGSSTFLMRETLDIPDGWEPTFQLAGVQMIADDGEGDGDRPTRRRDVEPIPLEESDVPDMLALVERSNPGPFKPGTIRFGTFMGVRVDGALVAMAGERIRPPAHTEVTAVSTDPAFRGRGLATALVRAMNRVIRARGERPMLHAAADNTNALRLYEALGFRHSRDVQAAMVRAPD